MVYPRRYYRKRTSGYHPVLIKTRPEVASWTVSTNNEATFSPKPVELIKSMKTARQLIARVTPENGEAITSEWTVIGLTDALRPLEEHCPLGKEPTPLATPIQRTTPTRIPMSINTPTTTPASARKVKIHQGEVRPVVQVSHDGGQGTGFAIDTNYVVTNAHVVTRLGDVTIELHDGSEVDGVVVSRGRELRFEENRCIWWEDMALVRTNDPMLVATKLNLDRAVDISRGDTVEVYGYPEGHQNSRAKRIDNMRIESFASVGIDLTPKDGTENQVQGWSKRIARCTCRRGHRDGCWYLLARRRRIRPGSR